MRISVNNFISNVRTGATIGAVACGSAVGCATMAGLTTEKARHFGLAFLHDQSLINCPDSSCYTDAMEQASEANYREIEASYKLAFATYQLGSMIIATLAGAVIGGCIGAYKSIVRIDP